jgi:uncharacterized membrane protein
MRLMAVSILVLAAAIVGAAFMLRDGSSKARTVYVYNCHTDPYAQSPGSVC